MFADRLNPPPYDLTLSYSIRRPLGCAYEVHVMHITMRRQYSCAQSDDQLSTDLTADDGRVRHTAFYTRRTGHSDVVIALEIAHDRGGDLAGGFMNSYTKVCFG